MPYRVRLVPNSREATPAPDAWNVLQTLRGMVGPTEIGAQQVGLDHLLTSAYRPAHRRLALRRGPRRSRARTVTSRATARAASQYAMPGWGGRQPVNWLGGSTARTDFGDRRRPVVAVLDTGVGEHDWLPPDIVTLDAAVLDVPIADPERHRRHRQPLRGRCSTPTPGTARSSPA